MEFKYCKLEIFLPPTHLEVVQKALQEVDAGHIGNYDSWHVGKSGNGLLASA